MHKKPWLRMDVPIQTGVVVPLSRPQRHYLQHVLRLASGSALELVDPHGNVVTAKLTEHGDALPLGDGLPSPPSPRGKHLVVAASIPKGGRADWLVEKLAELGVGTLQWLHCQWSSQAAQATPAKLARWQRIAEAAAQQSENAQLLQILPPQGLPALLQQYEQEVTLLAHPGSDVWLTQLPAATPPATTVVMVGPEGGFSPDEVTLAEQHGAIAVRLPVDGLLRIETAALLCAGLLMHTP